MPEYIVVFGGIVAAIVAGALSLVYGLIRNGDDPGTPLLNGHTTAGLISFCIAAFNFSFTYSHVTSTDPDHRMVMAALNSFVAIILGVFWTKHIPRFMYYTISLHSRMIYRVFVTSLAISTCLAFLASLSLLCIITQFKIPF